MEDYIGTIKLFAGPFIPRGWYLCNGQLLSIASNQPLFHLLGTTYGGDGTRTFALPDLRGIAPMGAGNGPGLTPRSTGQKIGEETHTLKYLEMPNHTHATQNKSTEDEHILLSTDAAVNEIPQIGDVLAVANFGSGLSAKKVKTFGPATNLLNGQKLNTDDTLNVNVTGGEQPHNNMQPYLGMQYIICWEGIWPPRS